ncbi:MAG: acyltransferase family protein [Lachnospiraceae bacterium]|nr:acyltransferase family protein [Lachnospiraceae bacterium]
MNSGRDERIDAVKGVAIWIVMLGHCIVLNGLADPYFYDAIAAVQMPLFMAVSGYTAGRFSKPFTGSVKERGKAFLKVFGRRSLSYLLPFFSWMLVTHITNPIEELKLQLFATDRGLWFLMTLWIITVLALLGEVLSPKENLRWLAVSAVMALGGVAFLLQQHSGNTFLSPALTVKYLPSYYVFYMGGLLLRQREAAGKVADPAKTKAWNLRLSAACMAVFLYLVYAFDMVVAHSTFEFLLQELAGLCGSFAVFAITMTVHEGTRWKLVPFIGRFTLEIYVLHFRFARLLGIGDRALTPFTLPAVLWVLAAFLVMSMCTFLSIWLMKKVWFLDLIFFGKPSRPQKIGSKEKEPKDG